MYRTGVLWYTENSQISVGNVLLNANYYTFLHNTVFSVQYFSQYEIYSHAKNFPIQYFYFEDAVFPHAIIFPIYHVYFEDAVFFEDTVPSGQLHCRLFADVVSGVSTVWKS